MGGIAWGSPARVTASSDWWSEVKKEKEERWMSIEQCSRTWRKAPESG